MIPTARDEMIDETAVIEMEPDIGTADGTTALLVAPIDSKAGLWRLQRSKKS